MMILSKSRELDASASVSHSNVYVVKRWCFSKLSCPSVLVLLSFSSIHPLYSWHAVVVVAKVVAFVADMTLC